MHRRALAALSLLLVAAFALAACGPAAKPDLTDPSAIITGAVASMQKAKTVHLAATVDGTINGSLTGLGSGDISLAGTTLEGDVDIAGSNAHFSASAPALLGLSADIIVVGTDTYAKVSLTGPKYQKSTTAAGTPTDPAAALKDLQDFLAKPEVKPTKKDDAACGSKKCYQVVIDLTADELKTLMPDQTIGDAGVTLTLLVEKDTLYPVSVTVALKGTDVGDLSLTLTLSNWDKPVTITAPPADQVEAAA
jgi:hypothetical protein